MSYLSTSLSFFRTARTECADLLQAARLHGFTRLALAGQSDLAEICIICSVDADVKIVSVVDAESQVRHVAGVPVVNSFGAIEVELDAVVITDLTQPMQSLQLALSQFGDDRVFVPRLLRLSADKTARAK